MARLMNSILRRDWLALAGALAVSAALDAPAALAMVSAIRNGEIVAQQEFVLEGGDASQAVWVEPGVYDVRFEREGLVTEIKRGMRLFEGTRTSINFLIRPGQGVRILEWAAGGLAREEVAARLSAVEAGLTKLQQPGGGAVSPRDKAMSGTACCTVTAIDTKTGVVTALDPATKRSFQFTGSSTLVAGLTKGQKVWANFDTQKVSVDGVTPCCSMVPGGRPGAVAVSPADQTTDMRTYGTVKWFIVGIDVKTGLVTAQNSATKRPIQFRVDGAKLLGTLKIGQRIWVDFDTQKVSVDGIGPCCTIVGTAARP